MQLILFEVHLEVKSFCLHSQGSKLILNIIESNLGVFLLDLINDNKSLEIIYQLCIAPAKEM